MNLNHTGQGEVKSNKCDSAPAIIDYPFLWVPTIYCLLGINLGLLTRNAGANLPQGFRFSTPYHSLSYVSKQLLGVE